ncbi:glycosyltransferase [uncultured Alistipes sp.]|uniref:glycosyltransferase n=1 Tax=uncultured Alistipes sp. TaxID=538949 RepID=UPI00272D0679|nr:glycosyltransferase [uncultured Alistipes sp.]
MKKRILFVIDNLKGGGAEKVLITYLRYIDTSLFDVDLFLINKAGIYLEDLPSYVRLRWGFVEPLGIVGRIMRRVFLYWPVLFRLFFIRGRYDVEVAFREDSSTRIVLKSFDRKSKKIGWLHTDLTRFAYYPTTPVKRYLRSLSKLDHTVCVSHGVETILHKLNPQTKGKTSVIYNPLDVETVRMQSALPFDDPFDPADTNLLTIGRIDDGKNHRFLIECMPTLLERNQNIRLWILGVGERTEELKQLCEEMHLTEHVRFLGFIKNPFPYLAHADLFVFSSVFEGLPTVLIEALILHKKIVSSYCVGGEEVLDFGKYGVLSRLDKDEYCSKVQQVLDGGLLPEVAFEERIADFGLANQCRMFNDFLND